MKYQINKTDIQINNKLHSEGSEVELTKEQIKGIENYLIALVDNEKQKLKFSVVSTKEGKNKSTIKSSGLSTVVSTKVEALAKDGRGKK
jgi:hypothetical protein